ncbi:hypothetical protein L211DRAFT_865638 [Terfezia boudieri ATCC MYA-4762]|uniref:Cyanovirin-N domain-containing protein n=1 Tax=Terfezia boudieri ATCC MYA-4762 TaxID=1051890 RepID=A0A3N4M249_9PEZI|nr:hypothetical protein L211DRAFT_865638 [Terfezia boudieri ATCC MYA-4762]
MYSLRNIIALIGGLLLLFQCVAGATVPPLRPLTCDEVSAVGFPLKNDCVAALAQIRRGEPEACTLQISYEFDYPPFGSCTIQTYSSGGAAHCLNGDRIHRGVNAILNHCTVNPQGTLEEYTGGQYQWKNSAEVEGIKGEGVRVVETRNKVQ